MLLLIIVLQSFCIGFLLMQKNTYYGTFTITRHQDGSISPRLELAMDIETLSTKKDIKLKVVRKIDVSNDQTRE